MSSALLNALVNGLGPIAVLIALGALWRWRAPGGLDAQQARRAVNLLVMYVFYPGLTYHVVTHARFGADFLWVPLYTWIGLLLSAALAWALFSSARLFPGLGRRQRGALILACAFGNILSIGLSVLQPVYGPEAARYAIYADILGISILFWSLGAGLASALGGDDGASGFHWKRFLRDFVRLPPVWAFAAGFVVNLADLPSPAIIDRTAQLLGQAVIPSMLLTIGMSLSPAALRRQPRILVAAVALKLVVMPTIVAALCLPVLGLNEVSISILLLAGTPTMMATIMLSERYDLDTELLAAVMVATTLAYFAVMPVWLAILVR